MKSLYLEKLCTPLMIGTALTLSQSLMAQGFDSYKGRTKFSQNNTKSSTNLIKKNGSKTINLGNSGTTDAFGRGTGINTVKDAKKDKTYVNLNPETAFGPEVITNFNFPDTSLEDLTKHMQKLTGIKLIMDGKGLKGKVSIISPSPITVGDAWKSYLTALEMNGFSLVNSGNFYKIVATRDIRYTPTKIYTGNYTPNTDNYVMRILPLKNIDSTEVTRSFRPFMSRYGRIIDIKQTNTIIVQDTGTNINRLTRLIKFIDVPGYEETLQIIPVKNSSAQEIAKLLDQILKGNSTNTKFKSSRATKGENISKIIAEPRTNTIIAMANGDGAKQLRDLIKKLDVKNVSRGGGRIHVYYINHGDAEALAKTLSTLVSGAQQSTSRTGRTSRLRSRLTQNDDSGSQLFSDDVKITADKDNNALVVTASPTDYLTLKEVINKLDVPRDQVYVEGLLMETNVNNSRELGVSLISATGGGNAQRIATGNTSDLTALLSGSITSLGGLFAGIGAGRRLTIPGPNGNDIEVNSINGLIKAIASSSSTNVLATPQVLALDNTEATFENGEQVPVQESLTNATGVQTTVRPQKVALTLKIKPQINKVTRFIKLKIDQTISDFSNRPVQASSGVATTERAINTTVVVRDKDTIAMGGLMRDSQTFNESKVPLLGDIPVLGWLFKSTSKEVTKLNLLFFLTPRILANYQKDNAANVKDILNRRSNHLKKAVGEEDPFGTTVKGLYEKVQKQEQGPLYDDSDRNYKETNENQDGIGGMSPLDELADVPNYQEIVQEVKETKSALKK
ncbi:MAG: type II secretion system secretin GspD [Bdellovibrionota bacterium]|jgi:general secretion pathway protein D|nr:type II secretion system secretin GspD [Bdellovibrionota bacterium]